MKKTAILLFIVSIVGIFLGFQYFGSDEPISPLTGLTSRATPSPTMMPVKQAKSSSIFVPYWGFGTETLDVDSYDTLLYFGVSTSGNGIDKEEIGYQKLSTFNQLAPENKKKLLVIRMIDTEINSNVLDSKNAQQAIIKESIETAKEYGFSGIVLDFEIKALAFDSVIKNITQFYTTFSQNVRAEDLTFDATLYGDTFYLIRPYDVKAIGNLVDNIYIMTYDFHKSRGNPGPNFPLSGKEKYGYDLPTMIDDFSKQVPAQKLIVTFGLFGYDWTVDDKNRGKGFGDPLSYAEISQKYLTDCAEKQCVSKRDPLSSETQITFTNAGGEKHVVWFEDPTSMEKKKTFLQSRGLRSTSIWAYSYF